MGNIIKAAPGRLEDARWIDLPSNVDSRGVLTVVESGRDAPFEIKRVYLLHNIVGDRGGHAHQDTTQIVTAVSGSFELTLSDGTGARRFILDDITRGLLFGPMLFIRMTGFSSGARALVLASTHYEKSRSIRSWEDYLAAIGA
jgi:hypothetical protein